VTSTAGGHISGSGANNVKATVRTWAGCGCRRDAPARIGVIPGVRTRWRAASSAPGRDHQRDVRQSPGSARLPPASGPRQRPESSRNMTSGICVPARRAVLAHAGRHLLSVRRDAPRSGYPEHAADRPRSGHPVMRNGSRSRARPRYPWSVLPTWCSFSRRRGRVRRCGRPGCQGAHGSRGFGQDLGHYCRTRGNVHDCSARACCGQRA